MLEQIVWRVVSWLAVLMALDLSIIEVRVIRPPREVRDAPSSNYPRQADFTFEVGVRDLLFPVTANHLDGAR